MYSSIVVSLERFSWRLEAASVLIGRNDHYYYLTTESSLHSTHLLFWCYIFVNACPKQEAHRVISSCSRGWQLTRALLKASQLAAVFVASWILFIKLRFRKVSFIILISIDTFRVRAKFMDIFLLERLFYMNSLLRLLRNHSIGYSSLSICRSSNTAINAS